MTEVWMRTRTPDGAYFTIQFTKPPTIRDLDHMAKCIALAREGYVERVAPKRIKGVRVITLGSPEEAIA